MHRGFWELNKYKLVFAFVGTSILLLSLVQIFLLIAGISIFRDTAFAWGIFLGFGIISPALIFLVASWTWHRERKMRNKVFDQSPLKDLDKIGFENHLINEDSKWVFTEEIKAGLVGKNKCYSIVKQDSPKEIFFSIQPDWQKIDPKNMNTIAKELEAANIGFNQSYCIRKYDLAQLSKMNIEELAEDLLGFSKTLNSILHGGTF